jgi:hypothetical protein
MSLAGHNRNGHRVIVACAPLDQHEIGAMMLAVMLRREGYHVYYVGANTPIADLAAMARTVRPAAVMVSASSLDSVEQLRLQRAHLEGSPRSSCSAATASTRTRAGPRRSAASTSATTCPRPSSRLAQRVRDVTVRRGPGMTPAPPSSPAAAPRSVEPQEVTA